MSLAKEFVASMLRQEQRELSVNGQNNGAEMETGVEPFMTHPLQRDLQLAGLPDSDRAAGFYPGKRV